MILTCFSSLRHYNVVNFFGATLVAPRVGIVCEYCSKGALSDVIRKEKNLPWPQRLNILFGVAKGMCNMVVVNIALGMSFLHSKNIIHRDLKCDNVLVDSNYVPKIADFDIATSSKSQSLTQRIGTSYYMVFANISLRSRL